MLNHVRLLLMPPRYEDELLKMQANFLHFVLLIMASFGVVFCIIWWNTPRFFTAVVNVALPLICFWLLHSGRLKLAGIVFTSGQWLSISLSVITTGGVGSPSAMNYIVLFVVAAAALSEWWALGFTASSLVVMFGTMIAEDRGLLVVIEQSTFSLLVLRLAVFSLVTLLIFSITQTVRRSIARMNKAQRQYRTLFEGSTAPIMTFDLDGKVQLVNKASAEILQGEPKDFIGKRMSDYLPADVSAAYSAHMRQVLHTQQGEAFEEFARLHHRDYWFLTTIQPIFDENDKIAGIQMISQDITARKLAEQREQELKLAQEKDNLTRELLSNISHDLKTPLTLINLSLDMLEHVKDPERQHQKIEQIHRQIALVERFIQDMLALTELENSTELNRTVTHLDILLSQVVQQLLPKAEAKQIVLQENVSADLPSIMADEPQLRRVFANLIDNAITYTSNEGCVDVCAALKEGRIVIEVKDTGMGIDEQDLPYLFERFYRTKTARELVKGGSGLGLPIVKRILDMHHYPIEVQSKRGEGTTFRVSVPV
jgi:two-component system phosphate regulon sensor histidine kinase PhoR